jgi:hypothetical protein
MRAVFLVSVDLDPDALELEARRAGLDLYRARQAVLCDLECRLHDSVRHRNAVERVGSSQLQSVPCAESEPVPMRACRGGVSERYELAIRKPAQPRTRTKPLSKQFGGVANHAKGR